MLESSQDISCVRYLYKTNISRTTSVPTIRDLILLLMWTKMVLQMLVSYRHLMQLMA